MSVQSVNRSADSTEFFRSLFLLSVSGLIYLITAMICGRGKEGYVVNTVHTVCTVYTVCTVHTVCTVYTVLYILCNCA